MTKLPKRGNEERTVYDHVVRLLSGHALHEGVLLDLGCGFGAVAASCAELGLDYLGVGAGSDGLEEIARQGFSTALVDLSETTALVERLEEVLAGRQLAAITALDLIERLARPADLLTALADMAKTIAIRAADATQIVGKYLTAIRVELSGIKAILHPWRFIDCRISSGWLSFMLRDSF